MKIYAVVIIVFCFFADCTPKITKSDAAQRTQTLRILSYNIHHCNPPSKASEGLIDLDAIAKAVQLQHPDLVALQEVDVNTNRSGKINEAEMLAQKLKMNFYFGKAIDYDGGDYGVAILSRFPLSGQQTFMLPKNTDPKAEQRVFSVVTAEINKGIFIRFASTHLDAQRGEENRIMQAKEINHLTEKESLPLIVAGDLNAAPGSETIKIFDTDFTRTCKECGFTIPEINPNKTIDHIGFKKGGDFHILSYEVIPEEYASDHLPILSVLELK